MRRLLHLVLFVAMMAAVRSYGVNDAYDRLKSGTRWVGDKTGVPAAERVWNERVVPGVVDAATHTVNRGAEDTMQGAERALEEPSGMWAQVVNGTKAVGNAMWQFVLGPSDLSPRPAITQDESTKPESSLRAPDASHVAPL